MHYFSSHISHSPPDKLHSRYEVVVVVVVVVWARLNKANLFFKGWSWGRGHATELYSYITFAFFTLLTGAPSCGRFHLSFWCWLKEKAVIVLRGPQACFELRALSQWRVGGPAKCQAHMATLARLNAGLCLALVLVPPSDSVCLYPSVSSFSPLSQMYMPSGLAPHLWISCLQSPDSSALCASDPFFLFFCALRHLPWLKSLYPCKRGKPINCVHC